MMAIVSRVPATSKSRQRRMSVHSFFRLLSFQGLNAVCKGIKRLDTLL